MAKNKAKPGDDPYAAMSGVVAEASPAPIVDPDHTTAPEGQIDPEHSEAPDAGMATPGVGLEDHGAAALVSGTSLPERTYRADADPLLIQALELFERIHAGGLLYSSAYTVYDMVLDLTAKIRESVVAKP